MCGCSSLRRSAEESCWSRIRTRRLQTAEVSSSSEGPSCTFIPETKWKETEVNSPRAHTQQWLHGFLRAEVTDLIDTVTHTHTHAHTLHTPSSRSLSPVKHPPLTAHTNHCTLPLSCHGDGLKNRHTPVLFWGSGHLIAAARGKP